MNNSIIPLFGRKWIRFSPSGSQCRSQTLCHQRWLLLAIDAKILSHGGCPGCLYGLRQGRLCNGGWWGQATEGRTGPCLAATHGCTAKQTHALPLGVSPQSAPPPSWAPPTPWWWCLGGWTGVPCHEAALLHKPLPEIPPDWSS